MSSAICFNLDQSKILSSGNGLIVVMDLGFETGCFNFLTNDNLIIMSSTKIFFSASPSFCRNFIILTEDIFFKMS